MFARLFLTVKLCVLGVTLLWLAVTPFNLTVAAASSAESGPNSPATVFFVPELGASTVITAVEPQPAPTATAAPAPTATPAPTPGPATTEKSSTNPPIILIFAGAFLVLLLGATLLPFLKSRLRR